MKSTLLETLEKQVILGYTGKINLMSKKSGQILGCALLLEGSLINVKYKGRRGVKAFYSASLDSIKTDFKLIVEPEFINSKEREITTTFTSLKERLAEVIAQEELTKESKPPCNILLKINPSFLSGNIELKSDEYKVLCTLVSHSVVDDIYQKNSLLDFQITNALIGLRQKKAIKVAAQKGEVV